MRTGLPAYLAIATTVAVLLLAATSSYSAWVSSTNHTHSCARNDLILDAFHDVIVLALTPQPGTSLKAAQVKQIEAFETVAFARLNQARC